MNEQADHLERLYRKRDDPWDYASSSYEAAKYAATLAALRRHRYAFALEAGCSIGVLGARLAPRCDRLLAVDRIDWAVTQAAARLAPHTEARAMRATLPGDWPPGGYDLILLSELIYYLTAHEINAMACCVARDAVVGAECVLAHYQGDTDTDIRPNAARDRFCAILSGLRPIETIDHPSPAAYNHRTLVFRA